MAYRNKADQAAAAKRHYDRNAAAIKERAIVWTREQANLLRRIVVERKRRPCMDCGVEYPHYVMDFDHIGDDKVGNVATMAASGVSVETLLAEIAKCEVVCANCHRVRTFTRRQQRGQLDAIERECGDDPPMFSFFDN